jgi:hypothetical protein
MSRNERTTQHAPLIMRQAQWSAARRDGCIMAADTRQWLDQGEHPGHKAC